MKKIWIVIGGVEFEDCQFIAGCYTLESSARKKIEEMRTEDGYDFQPNSYREDEWCYQNCYIRLTQEDLHED